MSDEELLDAIDECEQRKASLEPIRLELELTGVGDPGAYHDLVAQLESLEARLWKLKAERAELYDF